MQRPGASTHTGEPASSAPLACAQYSIVPQLNEFGSPRPMNCSPAAARTAYSAAPKKIATMSDVMLGRISNTMM